MIWEIFVVGLFWLFYMPLGLIVFAYKPLSLIVLFGTGLIFTAVYFGYRLLSRKKIEIEEEEPDEEVIEEIIIEDDYLEPQSLENVFKENFGRPEYDLD